MEVLSIILTLLMLKTDEPWMTDGVGSFVAAGYSSVAGENGTYVVTKQN